MISRATAALIVENDLTVEIRKRVGAEGDKCIMVEIRCKSQPGTPALGYLKKIDEIGNAGSAAATMVEIETIAKELARHLNRHKG